MIVEHMDKKNLNDFLNNIDIHIIEINELYKKYKFWNKDYIDKYKEQNGFSIDEIILMHIHKNLKIE